MFVKSVYWKFYVFTAFRVWCCDLSLLYELTEINTFKFVWLGLHSAVCRTDPFVSMYELQNNRIQMYKFE